MRWEHTINNRTQDLCIRIVVLSAKLRRRSCVHAEVCSVAESRNG